MPFFVYNISLRAYYFAIMLASLFSPKAKLWLQGRQNLFAHIKKTYKPSNQNIVWVHCASLGEFEQARPLIEAIKKDFAHYKIVLTFFSPSGYEIRKNYPLADYVYYLPLDLPNYAKQFIKIIQPKLAIFVKYEVWLNYFKQLKNAKIPLLIVSASYRPSQIFFKPYGKIFREALRSAYHIFVQNRVSFDLLKSINVNQISLTGDTRFDRVYATYQNAKELALIKMFKADKFLLVGGSTWEAEEKLLSAYQHLNPTDVKIIIAPHNIDKANVQRIELMFRKAILYSEANNDNVQTADVLIIDNIGLLASIYAYADIAIVGGGFRGALHNILEAAVFGVPVLYGPHFTKQPEAKELAEAGGGFIINNQKTFFETINHLSTNKAMYVQSSQNAHKFIFDQRGATQKIMTYLQKNKLLQ